MSHLLYDTVKKMNYELTEEMLAQFSSYEKLLVEWNEKMNLTAITEHNEVVIKHFADSLFGLKFIKESSSIIDVGTGAGFPGLPLKIARPDIKLTLLDSLNKRLNFLTEVKNQLGLSDVTCVHSRAEDGAKSGSDLRESFDVATSRAVANLSVLCEYCLPYLKRGGVFLAYKGSDVDEELMNAQNAIETLGGEVTGVYQYNIPDTDINHSVVVITKVRNTPDKYPRLQGKIQKKPL